MAERSITARYSDPLDALWLGVASKVGLDVRRSEEVFASTDGRGTLSIGEPSTLDPDDCLAQMVFHELCHSLVEGHESFERPDWGLGNYDGRDLMREHACLRTQAHLARRHGLARVLAPTTEHRRFYDGLGLVPLSGTDESVVLARRAVARSARDPWAPHLEEALGRTRKMLEQVQDYAPRASLLADLEAPLDKHPSGLWSHPAPPGSCGECAWFGDGCQQVLLSLDPRTPACERFEREVACEHCGACCREAYDCLDIGEDDPAGARFASHVERVGGRRVMLRVEGRCPMLDGGGETPYRCARYDERPQTCRDFTRGGEHCAEARRRVGLGLEPPGLGFGIGPGYPGSLRFLEPTGRLAVRQFPVPV